MPISLAFAALLPACDPGAGGQTLVYDGVAGGGGSPNPGTSATGGTSIPPSTNNGGAPPSGGGTTSLGGSGGTAGTGPSQGGAGQGGGGAGTGGAAGGTAGMGGTGGTAGAGGSAGAAGAAGAPNDVCAPGAPTPPSGGANHPFPQHRLTSSCIYPPQCNSEDARVGWEVYKQRIIVDGGDGTLRVQRPEFDNDTVSEGIAYGMLFAVYMNDKDTFDRIWRYAERYFDGNGLMHWRVDAGGNVTGANSATDSDEDMAFALVMADVQWGGYGDVARSFLDRVATHDFHGDGTIRGGDAYDEVNPSYLAPAFYRVFARYTGDQRWMRILDKSYEILNGAAHPTTGLVPDWSTGDRGRNYTYDAARTPYRIALDACWFDEPRARAYVEKVGTFFDGVGVASILDGYTLDGTSTGEHHNATFVGPAGVAGMVSKHPTLVSDAYDKVALDLHEGTENYYNLSWALFTVLLMTGNFVDLTSL
ncbi:MAG: glycosyl hydrolase family 8 [Pseudomonadota bacterium]